MVYKTYINKFNTIIKDSEINTGLNPVSELVYGKDNIVSRALLYFDHSAVANLYHNGIMPDMAKMKHILHITNGGSIDFTQLHDCGESSVNLNSKMRAMSFDLIFFLIPNEWDRGRGFDYTKSYLYKGYYSSTPIDPKRLVSYEGSNWYQRMNGLPWDEEGVYSTDTLSKEYDKMAEGNGSVVIGRQHFDAGNENIELDITDVFNRFIDDELKNYGIGIAFSPLTEGLEMPYECYLSLLTDTTPSFFAPYVETMYDDVVSDDRTNFVIGKENKLYLYCTIGEHLETLDASPTVTIRDSNDEVVTDANGRIFENVESTLFSKGIYYVDLKLSQSDFKGGTMLYDTWGGLTYHGTNLEPVELDFTLKSAPNYFNIGNSIPSDIKYSPTISGIMEQEQILRGDIRKLSIYAAPQYTSNMTQLVDSMAIRLYVMDGTRKIDVISWDKVNKSFSENFYVLDTNILLPQRYHIDLRIYYGMSSIVHHDVLSFDIISSLNNKFA